MTKSVAPTRSKAGVASTPKRKSVPKSDPKSKISPKLKVVTKAPRAPKAPAVNTWNDMIIAWEAGKQLPDVKGSIYWETFVANAGGESPYRVKTKSASRALPLSLAADANDFKEHMKSRKTPVSFLSKGKPPTLLVVPPDTGKNFSHLGTFYKNSTLCERRALWKKVVTELERKLKKGEKVYVSTHGTGVSWLHIRLSSTPKYYVTSLG